MKLLNDLSQDELVELSPEQKQQVYLLELAERGIALPSATPEYMDSPAERDDLQPDTTLYNIVTGYSSSDLWFDTQERAAEVAALLGQKTVSVDYDYVSGSDRNYHITDRGAKSFEIKAVPAYSMDRYSKLKDELKKYNDEKDKIDRNNRRRQEIIDKQSVVMSEIDTAIVDAETKTTRVTQLAGMFAEYTKMAEGNHTIAVRFMLNAHYDEVSKYEDQYLGRIGITRDDVNEYEKASFGNTDDGAED